MDSNYDAECLRVMFADNQILLATNEDGLQRMVHSLNNTAKEFKVEISDKKNVWLTKKQSVESKIVIDSKIVE